MSASLAVSIPKSAIVLPPNVRVQSAGGTLILQKVKRRTKRFKMSKAQRQKISAASRKFKVPILTAISVAPAVLLSAQDTMVHPKLMTKLMAFTRSMLSYYTGIFVNLDGTNARFMPERLLVGWGPIVAVGTIKAVAKGRVMAINRALSRAQIPANLG